MSSFWGRDQSEGVLNLTGRLVEQVAFDYALSILLSGGVQLRVETNLRFARSDDLGTFIDPEKLEEAGDKVLELVSLLHKPVSSALANKDGSLEIAFEGQGRLLVQSDEQYEAWQIVSDAGERLISTPGGELTYWPPRPNEAML